MEEKKREPWWRNGWVAGLVILGLLHLTGTAVHVQAGVQRVLLATGLFHPDVIPAGERVTADLNFQFRQPDGTVASLSDLDGEVRFVNFWATWCAPCLAEMPAIDRLHGDYGDRVEFVMVTVDDDPERAETFMSHKEYGLEAVSPASRIPAAFRSDIIPTTVIVDRAGRIALFEAGMADYDSRRFRRAVDQLLAEGP